MVIMGFDVGAALTPDVSLLETVVRGVVTYFSIFVLLRVILRGRTSAVTVSDLLVLVLIADARAERDGRRLQLDHQRRWCSSRRS